MLELSASQQGNSRVALAALSAINQEAYHQRLKHPATALGLAREAKEQAELLGNGQERQRALTTMGVCQMALDKDYRAAKSLLQEALESCEQASDDTLKAEVLLELAFALTECCEADTALDYGQEALELNHKLNCPEREAKAWWLLGHAYTQKGEFSRALEAFFTCLEGYETLGYEHLSTFFYSQPLTEKAALFRGIAVVYSNLGEYQKAISHYHVALPIYRSINPSLAARTLYNIGIAYEELKDFSSAMLFYQESTALYESQPNNKRLALSLMGMGRMQTVFRDFAEAEESLKRALAMLEHDPDQLQFYTDALSALARLHMARGQHQEALAPLERALAINLETGRANVHIAGLHEYFFEAYKALGDFRKALEHHERYCTLLTKHLEEAAAQQTQQIMVQFETERAHKDREIYQLRTVELEREIAERKEIEQALAKAKDELEHKNEELAELSTRDPLTHLYNRRQLDHKLQEVFGEAQRYARPLSVMIGDIDNFKKVNDTFSHTVGDEVIKIVAQLLAQNLRQTDITARYGGEEFVVIFPETGLPQATLACEKLRQKIAAYPWFEVQPGLEVTMSLGVATLEYQTMAETLLLEADRKLYEAKHSGKNRVCF